jgi:hypothetical protein
MLARIQDERRGPCHKAVQRMRFQAGSAIGHSAARVVGSPITRRPILSAAAVAANQVSSFPNACHTPCLACLHDVVSPCDASDSR